MFKIYTLSDPVTKEIRYVGKTSQKLNRRLCQHLCDSKKKTRHVCTWIRKIGKPIIEELDFCETRDESIFLEQYWISQMRTWNFRLTNHTDGGEGPEGMVHSEESRQKMRESHAKRSALIPKKPKKIRISKEEHRQLFIRINSIPILQYTLDGDFMAEWPSSTKATEFYSKINSKNSGSISDALKYEKAKSTAYGFLWRKKIGDDIPDKIKVDLSETGYKKRVKVTNLETNEIIIFESVLETAKYFSLNACTIIEKCKRPNKGNKNTKNYKFEYLS